MKVTSLSPCLPQSRHMGGLSFLGSFWKHLSTYTTLSVLTPSQNKQDRELWFTAGLTSCAPQLGYGCGLRLGDKRALAAPPKGVSGQAAGGPGWDEAQSRRRCFFYWPRLKAAVRFCFSPFSL